MNLRHDPSRTMLLLLGALSVLAGCRIQTRVEPVRPGWAYRGGGHWFEMHMASVELGPGGPRTQSVTGAVTSRILRGRNDEGRLEGAMQLRLHLWRAHRAQNMWGGTNRPYDPADPNMRRRPCGNHFHVYEYEGRGYTEAFSVGVLFEGMLAGSGRWVPNGYDSRGRPQDTLSNLQLDWGVAGGMFARFTTAFWMSFNLDAGWEYAYGASGPYVRGGIGLPLDLSVDRTQPRMQDEP